MGNMSYCQFQNTLIDLRDCQEALEAGALDSPGKSDEELRAAEFLIRCCEQIAKDFGDEEA